MVSPDAHVQALTKCPEEFQGLTTTLPVVNHHRKRHHQHSCRWGRRSVVWLLASTTAISTSLTEAASPHDKLSFPLRRLPGQTYEYDSMEDEMDTIRSSSKSSSSSPLSLFVGAGRELSLFDCTTSSTQRSNTETLSQSSPLTHDASRIGGWSGASRNDGTQYPYRSRSDEDTDRNVSPIGSSARESNGKTQFYRTGGRNNGNTHHHHHRRNRHGGDRRSIFHPITDWWSSNVQPNVKHWPKIQCRVEPTTTLKIRKTFRPLKTIVRLSAHFNTQRGVWQFKSSWEDAIIGGKLTLAGRKELQLTKSWQLSVGPVEDLVTRLRLRAAVDLQTYKAYVRVGFRTERLSPINVMEGFSLLKQVPLDGQSGHVKLEIKANFALPEPEIEYSTETQRSLIGMGDIEVGIEELNLLLDY